MLVSARPVLPEGGVPPPELMAGYEEGMAGFGGLDGLDGFTDWLQSTVSTVVEKIQLPGFGTPVYAPGTVITQSPQGSTIVRQTEGYPVTAPTATLKTGLDISAGAGVMLAGAAVLIGLVMISRGGGKK